MKLTPERFLEEVHSQIDLKKSGDDRYVVRVPLTFGDGDHYVIIFKKDGKDWIVTDEGNTLMHVGILKDYGGGFDNFDVEAAKQIKTILGLYKVEDRQGQLAINVSEKRFGGPGRAVFDLVEAITEIKNITKKDPEWRGSHVEHKVTEPWKYEDHNNDEE